MKRKLKTLTEQFTDARTNYNRILGRGDKSLINEQSGGSNFIYQVPPVYTNQPATPNNCPPEGCRRVGVRYCGASGGGDAQGLGNNLGGGALKYLYDNSLQIGDLVTMVASDFPWNNGINAFYSDQNKVTGVIAQLSNTYSGGGSTQNPNDFAPKASLATWPYDPSLGNANDPDCGGAVSTPCQFYGCTDSTAINYNAAIDPNCDDGSCILPNQIGCTDPNATNYNPQATIDDGSCILPQACDTTPNSPCAQQWFQNPNATWASTWINNRDCSNYTWPSTNLETQALSIMASAPNPQPNVYNDWNDIWGAADTAFPNITGPPKNTFIAKMAKAKYSQCQKQACNC